VGAGARGGTLEVRGGDLSRRHLRSGGNPRAIYRSGTTGHPERRCNHACSTACECGPRQLLVPYREGGVYYTRRRFSPSPTFHSCLPRRPSDLPGHDSEVQPTGLLARRPNRAGHADRPGADDDQSPHSIQHLADYDLGKPGGVGIWGSPMAPELISSGEAGSAHVKWCVLWPERNGFLTGLQRIPPPPRQAAVAADPARESMWRVTDESGQDVPSVRRVSWLTCANVEHVTGMPDRPTAIGPGGMFFRPATSVTRCRGLCLHPRSLERT